MRKLRGRRSHSGLGHLVFAQAFPMAASLITTFATSHLLAPEARGSLAYFVATASLIGSLLFFNLHVGATEVQASGGPGLRGALKVYSAIALIFLTLTLAGQLFQAVSWSTTVLAWAGTLVGLNLVILRSLQALGRNRLYRDALMTQSLGYCVLGVGAAWATGSWIPVVGAWALMLCATTAVALKIYWRQAKGTHGRSALGDVIRPSVRAHAGNLGMQVMYRADIVILGYFSSRSSVAYYTLAVSLVSIVWSLAEAFSLRAFQRGEGGTQRHASDISLIRMNLILSCVLATAIASGSSLALPVLLPEYEAALPLMWILAAGVVVQAPARIALAVMTRQGKFRAVVATGALALALSFLYAPAARSFGAIGVAWASLIAYCIVAAFVLLLFRRTASSIHSVPGRAC